MYVLLDSSASSSENSDYEQENKLKLSVSILPHTKGLFSPKTYVGVQIDRYKVNTPEIYTLYTKEANTMQPVPWTDNVSSGIYYINYKKLKNKGILKKTENSSDYIKIKLKVPTKGGTKRSHTKRSDKRRSHTRRQRS